MRVTIDGLELDGLPDEPVTGTFAVADYAKFGKPKGGYSNNIAAKDTPNNRRVFQQVKGVLTKGQNIYKLAEAQVWAKGVPIFSGKALLEESGKEFNITILQGNSEWFSEIKDLELKDVDLSEIFTGRWTNSHVASRRLQTTGLFYPAVEYGFFFDEGLTDNQTENLTDVAAADADKFRPALQVKSVIEQIEKVMGWKFKGLSDLEGFDELCLPFTKGEFTRSESYLEKYKFRVMLEQDFSGGVEPWTFDRVGAFKGEMVDYIDQANGRVYFKDNVASRNHLWLVKGRYRVISVNNINPNYPAQMQVGSFSVDWKSKGVHEGEAEISSNTTGGYIELPELSLSFGSTALGAADTYVEIAPVQKIEFLDYFEANDVAPDIKVSELLGFIAAKYALQFIPDRSKKEIQVKPLRDSLNRKLESADWSNKIDLSEDYSVKYRYKDYGQINKLRYAVDGNDNLNSQEGIFTIHNEQLKKEVELLESPFRLFDYTQTFQGNRSLPKLLIYPDPDGDAEEIDPVIAKAFLSDRNLVLTAGQVPSIYPNYDQAAVLSVAGLTWPEMLGEYWSEFIESLQDIKLIEAYFMLELTDVLNLDFTRPVYVDYFKSYFLIQEIKQFRFNERMSTKVKLFKIK